MLPPTQMGKHLATSPNSTDVKRKGIENSSTRLLLSLKGYSMLVTRVALRASDSCRTLGCGGSRAISVQAQAKDPRCFPNGLQLREISSSGASRTMSTTRANIIGTRYGLTECHCLCRPSGRWVDGLKVSNMFSSEEVYSPSRASYDANMTA
ncbi:hypothetical protein FA95DRAFT_1331606 [Auriscalpium vulgare]|uniref:Uncharacterized protein n=1 Tax=Auriscalpium vulgare TaxID=40419 RepID=A0ACB8S8A0_9AGAM|nr:hypothetical protein FA95DRAFT_1331606 [Auriscalpium vulgare]